MRWPKLLTVIFITLHITGCGRYVGTPSPETLPQANTTIERLHSYLSKSDVAIIEEDVVVVGRVTSSDAAENFFRTMTIEDESGGIELLVGEYDLHTAYPEGLNVALRLRDCALGYRYGVLQAGSSAEAYTNYDIDYLATRQAIDRVIVRSLDVEPRNPLHKYISELDDSMCGRLLRIDSLQLIGSTSVDTLAGETIDRATWQGYSMFVDSNHDTLVVYTREYARYATHLIPNTTLSLQGIVQYAKHPVNNRYYYQLKMRDEKDCIHN